MWDSIERWLLAGIGACVAIGGWVWNRQVSRTDSHADRLDALERNSVGRDEFNITVSSLRKDFRESEVRIAEQVRHGQEETRKSIERLSDRLIDFARVERKE